MTKKQSHNQMVKSIFNPKFHSIFFAILGPNQSGKTDMALWLMEICFRLGLYKHFAGNVPLENTPFPYTFIEDLPTLKQHCQMLNKRLLFLGDELGSWAPKDQPWLNVKIIKELQQVRKYKLSMIGCAIDRVDSRVLNEKHFHGKIEKSSKKRQDRAILYDWINNRKGKIFDIPKTSILFDTWYSAMFYMNPQQIGDIPLSPEHQIVKKYLKLGSWKKVDIHPQEGKRAVRKVLMYHFDNCLTQSSKVKEPTPITETQRAS